MVCEGLECNPVCQSQAGMLRINGLELAKRASRALDGFTGAGTGASTGQYWLTGMLEGTAGKVVCIPPCP